VRRLLRALALALWAGGAGAEAPETAPVPPARPEAEAPSPALRPEAAPPGRPQARPDAEGAAPAGALVVEIGPGAAAPEPMRPPRAGVAGALPEADAPPAQARLAPVLREAEGNGTALGGPRQMVRAELAMSEPPPVPVIVGGWEGEAPPVRPGTAPPVEGAEGAALRPRARPLPPADPVALLPPEPDAPPAYSPRARPDTLPVGPEYSPLAVAAAVMPRQRPSGIVAQAVRVSAQAARGQVCGDPRIQGEVVAAVRGGGGCGIEEAVRIRSVDGVRLSEAALMDCTTAQALLAWVRDGARPALGGRGGGLAGLQVAGHYACRPRNNQAGARLSEHGRGRAIDIGAVILADGSRLTVLRHWGDPAMRAMHRAACGPFSTTLGPGSDGFHEDHFHFDTARRGSRYCR
jgi:hypothetical protein